MLKHINKLIFSLILFSFISCIDVEIQSAKPCMYKEDKAIYKTDVVIYWNTGSAKSYVLYSKDSIYTCSFQGTNFILEKNNEKEIYSTTAPIEVKQISKIN